ncbi:MAG: NAD(P)/FAD-dependent oxidoreductase [Smithellaceae bacterium]
MKVLCLNGLTLTLDEKEECLKAKAAHALGIEADGIILLAVIRKALDARRNRPPHFVYAVKIQIADSAVLPEKLPEGMQIHPFLDGPDIEPASTGLSDVPLQRGTREAPGVEKLPVVVVGSGPAGLFAAYTLALSGISVLLLERGRPIEERVEDVRAFWEKGVLDPQSNALFGEGGAGTFSDGKLTSRTKNPYAGWVKKVLVEMGAPSSILTDAKPHIGTDRLRRVLINLRRKLLDMGCEIRFRAQVTDIIIPKDAVAALVINKGEEIQTDKVVLAIGQSADDTYSMLDERGVKMEAKPFAMGLRVEHPQALINSIQYGKWSDHPSLPPAEYFVTAAVNELNRSVYTFCMCPGGQVIGCSAFPGVVITNGMSSRQRDGEFANSAVVVNVRAEDFAVQGEPLSGLAFRRHWEKEAYLAGGDNYCAPAERLCDFIEQKASGVVGRTSFLPGVKAARLSNVLPGFVADALRIGIKQFDKKMPGFISPEAHLIGVETRTSSPVRISRGADGQSENAQGLYPCGEGAGYAGGIISSALDGIKAAKSVIAAINGCR